VNGALKQIFLSGCVTMSPGAMAAIVDAVMRG
jgi:hypothetical protein